MHHQLLLCLGIRFHARAVAKFVRLARLATILVVGTLAGGCDWGDIDGNGERVTETREHTDFVAVESRSSVDVAIRQGDAYEVVVSIDSNLMELLETRVTGNRLIIDSEHSLDPHVKGPHVTVTLPTLEAAKLSGSGAIEISAGEQAVAVKVVLSGSGNIDFDGTTPDFSAQLDGSGDIVARGSADHVDLRLDGSGVVNARELIANSGFLGLSGSGDIRATINGSAEASLSGSGDIDLYGDVALKRRSLSGSGDIRVH